MAGLNVAIVSGRIGKDPEIKRFNNGDEIANFSIATSETWTDKRSGDRKEKTEWHNIKVQGEHFIKVVRQFLNKGDRVTVQGKIETRSWEKDGEKRYSTEIVVGPFKGEIALVETKNESGRGGGDDRGGGRGRGRDNDDRRRDDDRSKSQGSTGYNRDLDDEIPFAPEFR